MTRLTTLNTNNAPAVTSPTGGAWTYRYAGSRAQTPTLTDDGAVLLVSRLPSGKASASLRCIDRRTTTVRWETVNTGEYSTPPVIDAGDIFIGNTDGGLYAFRAADRSALWYPFYAKGPITGQIVVADRYILFGTTKGTLWCVDRTTGAEAWYSQSAWNSGVRVARPALYKTTVVTAMSQGSKSQVALRSTAQGRVYWLAEIAYGISTDPVIAGDIVYYGCDDGTLLGFGINDLGKVMYT